MGKIAWVFGVVVLVAGCQSALASDIQLIEPIGSAERMKSCATDWRGGQSFIDCLKGTKYTRKEFCAYTGTELGNPWLSDWQKAAIYEKMRTYGCLG